MFILLGNDSGYTAAVIEPIDNIQQTQVLAETEKYRRLAEDAYLRNIPAVPVQFNLRGGSAGMFQVKGRESCIRYNPWLFAKYFDENLLGTVPHEVAHMVVHRLYGLHRVKPHGPEWRAVMSVFDADPTVTSDFDLEGIPQRQQRRFRYLCDCREHLLSTRRHNTVQRGKGRYQCRICGGELRYQPLADSAEAC